MHRPSHDNTHENAMTEIALALAMGFFSLMVLTLISMGAGKAPTAKSQTIVLAPVPGKATGKGTTSIKNQDLILIYDGDHFFDTAMNMVDPQEAIRTLPGPATRVVLALDPNLSLRRTIKARGLLNVENLVVASLDAQWLKALSERRQGE